MTAYAETNAGIVFPLAAVSESTRGRDVMIELLESRIAQLEMDEAGNRWARLGEINGREFSRSALDDIIDLSRVMYLKNPLVHRAVEVGKLYVWGQDLSVKTKNDGVKKVIDRFEKENATTYTGQQASGMLDVERRVTGNVFLALFTNKITGSVKVRPVPVEEIRKIITNPDDRFEVWYYLRQWTEQPVDGGNPVEKKALYPHIDYTPDEKLPTMKTSSGEIEIRWDSPIHHQKSGAFLLWLWGIPETYAALDWATSHTGQLTDDASRSRSLAKIAIRITTDGGKPAVDAAKARLASTLGIGNRVDTNPPPAAGASFVGDKSIGFDPVKLQGTMLDPEHSRPARLMVASATGIPDTMLSGDVDQGTLATAKSMDRPTELNFTEDRECEIESRERIYDYVIRADLAATRGIIEKSIAEEDLAIEFSWPDLLERDITESVGAVVSAAPFLPEMLTAKLLMQRLGVEDVDEQLEQLEIEKADAQKRAAELAAQQAKAAQQQQPLPGQQPPVPAKEAFIESEIEVADLAGVVEWVSAHVPTEQRALINATLMKPASANG